MNIVLIGMRGSSKSTIGKILSARLNKTLIETDVLIEKKEKLPAGRIISQKGINYFRRKEEEVFDNLINLDNMIIATGGGVVENRKIMKNLKKKNLIVYLQCDPQILFERIGDDAKRPLLTKAKSMLEDLENLFLKRSSLYEKYADLTLNTKINNILGVNNETRLCCIIGNPVSHSLSPVMHNAAYRKLGLNYLYLAIGVTNLKAAIKGLKELDIRGISVTAPFKEKILEFVDEIDKTAKKIGAANTVLNTNGKFRALNTDWIGAIRALAEKSGLNGKKIIIRGAGGAARAIAYGLKKKKARVKILNRTLSNAKLLSRDFRLEGVIGTKNLKEIENADILINSSTLGMHSNDDLPFLEEFINKNQIVFDIVYTPAKTVFIRKALERKAKIVYGYKMLLYQGLEQFKLFTGKLAPQVVVENSLLQYINTN